MPFKRNKSLLNIMTQIEKKNEIWNAFFNTLLRSLVKITLIATA